MKTKNEKAMNEEVAITILVIVAVAIAYILGQLVRHYAGIPISAMPNFILFR